MQQLKKNLNELNLFLTIEKYNGMGVTVVNSLYELLEMLE